MRSGRGGGGACDPLRGRTIGLRGYSSITPAPGRSEKVVWSGVWSGSGLAYSDVTSCPTPSDWTVRSEPYVRPGLLMDVGDNYDYRM